MSFFPLQISKMSKHKMLLMIAQAIIVDECLSSKPIYCCYFQNKTHTHTYKFVLIDFFATKLFEPICSTTEIPIIYSNQLLSNIFPSFLPSSFPSRSLQRLLISQLKTKTHIKAFPPPLRPSCIHIKI